MNSPIAVLAGAAGIAVGLVAATALPGVATPPVSLVAYGTNVNADAVHFLYYTSNNANFDQGLIAHRLPLAHVKQDAGPSSYATASTTDYGPLAGFVLTNDCGPTPPAPPPPPDLCNQLNPYILGGEQTFRTTLPYASAQYPGDPADASTSGPPAGFGRAHASELAADAVASYAGGPNAAFSGANAEAHSLVGADGSVTVSAHSVVASADILGAIQVSHLDLTSSLTLLNGTVTPKSHVTVGSVLVAGHPVSVTDHAITIDTTSQGWPQGTQGAGNPLPSSTSPMQVTLFLADPGKVTNSVNGASLESSGLHVRIDQPSSGPGSATQYEEFILGETSLTAFANPSTGGALGTGNQNPPPGSTYAPPPFTSYGGTAPSTVTTTITNTVTTGGAGGAADRHAPTARLISPRLVLQHAPILPLFILWQALTLAAVAALVWARRRSPNLAPQ